MISNSIFETTYQSLLSVSRNGETPTSVSLLHARALSASLINFRGNDTMLTSSNPRRRHASGRPSLTGSTHRRFAILTGCDESDLPQPAGLGATGSREVQVAYDLG